MKNDLALAYLTDLQYIAGRLGLIRYLKEKKEPAAAGQVMSDLLDHINHNGEGLRRLIEGSRWEAPRSEE